MRDKVQDDFEAGVRDLAARLQQSEDVAGWQRGMQVAVARYLVQQASLGAGRPVLRDTMRALDWQVADRITQQQAYLSRFAEEVAAKALVGRPLSPEQIAARATMYSGAGRALWFEGSERVQDGGQDTVVYYRSRDDAGTCDRCLEAQRGSPYAPGAGPMPGAICRGRGRCRCVREPRTDKQQAARLREAGG